MYKLMIAEDEPIVREGLKQYFNWEELGIKQIFDAENGKIGIQIALQEQPDIIITDIRMPELDGLEMIKQLRPKLPNTIFVILTGYNEFSYAQKAIGYGGVYDYLLKPLQYDEGYKTIVNCIKKIDDQRHDLKNRSKLELESKQNLDYRASQLIKVLVEEDSVDEQSIVSLYNLRGSDYLYRTFVLTCIPSDFSSPNQIRVWWRQNAKNIISDSIEFMFQTKTKPIILTYFHKRKLYACVVYPANNQVVADRAIEQELNNMLKRISNQHHSTLFLAVGDPVATLLKVKNSFQTTKQALYRRFFEKHRHVFFKSLTEKNNDIGNEMMVQLENRDKNLIRTYLQNGDFQQMNQLMKDLTKKLPYQSSEKLFAYLHEIITIVLQFANQNNMAIDGVYHDKLLTLECVDDFVFIEDLFDWFASWMGQLSLQYLNKANDDDSQENKLFDEIRSFIIQNIDQYLTLNIVAEHFFYNPSYLSRLFKTKLDKNYLTFVTEVRIDYAQQCLEDPNHSISEVCEMSGYKNYKHFVKLFKSVTHLTPTEYRKQLRM
ncbi:response regulator [Aquibacillus saliphilus]|uniref:response regulator n=1 Tax=Aquibacillus saliphilus TaxID=1909422 RepID=UPI001CF0562A|nr:response regulator [Aquibacillus saliphilus]